MRKLYVLYLVSSFFFVRANSQDKPTDTAATDYDQLFSEVDDFMNSMFAPRNVFVVNISVAQQYFNFKSGTNNNLRSDRKIAFTPSIAFYHKSGLGVSGAASIVNDNAELNPYQFSMTASYDYTRSFNQVFGISFTRFFTKDSLQFYASPLQNELYGYFLYRNLWVKPSVAITYGWGSWSDYEERENDIIKLRGRRVGNPLDGGTTTTTTLESISDFSVAASVRHDFYWSHILQDKSFFRVTPQLTFTSGTQRFGLNEVSSTYFVNKHSLDVLHNSKNVNLDQQTKFQPLALSAIIKTNLTYHKFFVQPQVVVDYYFPATENNLSTLLGISTGFLF
ncbi:MAG: hypothetical protein ICV66_08010 [Chitinophagaceae bacterium]|nr:hypothetical protein [Chitinophagaceae bacterium]